MWSLTVEAAYVVQAVSEAKKILWDVNKCSL